MKKFRRSLALFLAILTILSAVGITTFAATAETTLYSEKFNALSAKAEGTILTKDDGFGSTVIPSTTKVGKENGNTFVRIDLKATGDPNKTVYYTKSGSSYSLVEKGTPGATEIDEASYGMISGQDQNVDKNVIVKNPAVSYKTHETVVLETRYFLSEDASGVIQTQMYQYATAGTNKSWLSFYKIDTKTGHISLTGNVVTENTTLKRGEWNTVSLVINLKTGAYDAYLNNALASENGNLGAGNLEFKEAKWIVGKIPRTNSTSSRSTDLSGYFCFDDVAMYTPGDDTVYKVPTTNAAGEKLLYCDLKRDGVSIGITYGTQLLCGQGVTATPVYQSVAKYEGMVTSAGAPTICLERNGGLRFITKLDKKLYENLLADQKAGLFTNVEIGTLIAPQKYVTEAGAFTVEALEKLDYHIKYVQVPATFGEWYDDRDHVFAGSLLNIGAPHYTVDFAGVGYVAATLPNGEIQYFYSKPSANSVANVTTLANEALKNPGNYSEAELKVLNRYPRTELENGDTIYSIEATSNAIYFKINADTYCVLTNGGSHGWRLMAQNDGDIGFNVLGASQALAQYMDEEMPTRTRPITVEQTDYNTVTVRAEDGTYVELGIGEDFAIRFFTASGKRVYTVTSISVTDSKTVLTGALDRSEGIFGGGQRFDTVDKRGTSFDLYTQDGWNNSGTSYMAIPMFLTSRGGGLFINRYETISVDFGKANNQEWKITLLNEELDCYFWCTGEMEDGLTGYVDLTGHPDMPDEWMYGEIICRYSVDFRSLDQDMEPGTTNKDGAPSGRSVKTIINNLIAAGMKPSAALMEPYGWSNISNDNATAQANAKALKDTVDWLHSQGIKAMFYMGVASLNSNMKGYKPEYQVRAYVDGVLTHKIPKTSGTGTNPDVSTSSTQQYLDITNPEAVDWYMDVIWGQMMEYGVDGIKIDFCECMPEEGDFNAMSIDYVWYDETVFAPGTVHHSYPTYFISLFYREMNQKKAELGFDEGFMVLSRGGGIGSQRNPFLWAGDQARNFDKLDDQILAVINSGLSGVPFMTYDMAGYRYGGGGVKYTDENSLEYESGVMSRGVQFTAFTSNIQTHGTVRNAYELTEEAQQIYVNYTDLHEELYDYITKYAEIACKTGVPVNRHPVLKYQDDGNVYDLDDEFFLGDALLVAPIFYAEQTSRNVYLPAGSWTNLLTGEVHNVGMNGMMLKVNANIGQIPVFLDNNSEDADYLRTIFEGETWTAIKNWK